MTISFLESLKNNIMIECNSEKIAMTWGCNSRVLNKKYLHHKETHRKDFKFIPIKGTIERVYVLR